ncbi:hypothetical protein MRB53_039119 [Persea americana]|nr:hypothetical protein MRB53_039119 [Persea americana]
MFGLDPLIAPHKHIIIHTQTGVETSISRLTWAHLDLSTADDMTTNARMIASLANGNLPYRAATVVTHLWTSGKILRKANDTVDSLSLRQYRSEEHRFSSVAHLI